MRWMRISGLLISVILPMFPDHGGGTALQTFHLSLKEPVEGMTYALYEDPECRKPLENADGENIVLMTNENGDAHADAHSPFYLRQTGTVPGWYMEDEVFFISSDTLMIEPHPVSYVFGMEKDGEVVPAHLQILDEQGKIIADWKTEKKSVPFLQKQKVNLEPGKSYLLHNPDIRQWQIADDEPFEIPLSYDPENKEEVMLNQRSYGRAVLSIESDEKPVSDASVMIYEDADGEKQAVDIYGKKEVLHADQNGKIQIDLTEGTYYAGFENLDSSCYMPDQLKEFRVDAEETRKTELHVKPVLVSTSLQDPDGRKTDGTMILAGEGKEQEVHASTLHLKRNTDYVLKAETWPSGYHAGMESRFHTPEKESDLIEQNVILMPFAINGTIIDEETGRLLKDSLFQILDSSGKEVVRFSNELKDASRLQDASSYTIHCLSLPEGYLIPDDQILEIGTEGNVSFRIPCTPYVNVSAHVVNVSDGKPVEKVKWSLYKDRECQEILRDIYGSPVENAQGIRPVLNGTYYGKIMTEDPHFYPDETVYEIHADHAEKSEARLEGKLAKTDLQVKVENPDGKKIENVQIEVLDNNGRSCGTFLSTGDDSFEQAGMKNILKPSDVIYLQIQKSEGLYTWKERRTRVQLPDKRPAETPVIRLEGNPYVSLDVQEAGVESRTSGSTYVLSEEESCENAAMDIHGKKTESQTDQNGEIHWDMRPGTYWLKQRESGASAYLNEVPVKVVLDPENNWQEKRNFATVLPVIHFQTVDTKGESVNGGTYEILDEDGKRIHTFQAGGMVELKGKWLKPGKTLVFHETKAAAGYQNHTTDIRYTVPLSIPDQTPEIRIHCLRLSDRTSAVKKPSANSSPLKKQQDKQPWFLIPAAVLALLGIVIIMKTVSKQNENNFKND